MTLSNVQFGSLHIMSKYKPCTSAAVTLKKDGDSGVYINGQRAGQFLKVADLSEKTGQRLSPEQEAEKLLSKLAIGPMDVHSASKDVAQAVYEMANFYTTKAIGRLNASIEPLISGSVKKDKYGEVEEITLIL